MIRATRARRLRAPLQRFLALVTALAVVSGAWFAGQRYFYCAPMQRIAAEKCCAGHARDHRDQRGGAPAAIGEAPHRCCEPLVFDAGDRGASVAPPSVPPAPAMAVVAIVDDAPCARSLSIGEAIHDSRAGPPRAGPLTWRTRIDVSLS